MRRQANISIHLSSKLCIYVTNVVIDLLWINHNEKTKYFKENINRRNSRESWVTLRLVSCVGGRTPVWLPVIGWRPPHDSDLAKWSEEERMDLWMDGWILLQCPYNNAIAAVKTCTCSQNIFLIVILKHCQADPTYLEDSIKENED